MQLTEGSVVKSTAGHDRGRFGVIVGFENGWPLVADGKERKLEHPKRKNPKHLIGTREKFNLREIHGNTMLRRMLWPFQYGGQQPDFE
jgi:ribosomal protein L14E/L6E/L27E